MKFTNIKQNAFKLMMKILKENKMLNTREQD